MSETEDEAEREYLDPLETAMNLTGADGSTFADWAERLRRADDALDGPVSALVREGELQRAKELSDHGAGLQACAAFLDLLFAELENPRAA